MLKKRNFDISIITLIPNHLMIMTHFTAHSVFHNEIAQICSLLCDHLTEIEDKVWCLINLNPEWAKNHFNRNSNNFEAF